MFFHCFWRVTSLIIENKNESVVNINYFFSASQPNQIKSSNPALRQPLSRRKGLQGVGWADSPLPCHCSSKQHHHVLVVFVGWLNAIVSHQSLLFLHE